MSSNIRKTVRSNNVKLKENDDILNGEAVPNKVIEYFSNIASQLAAEVAPSENNAASYFKIHFPCYLWPLLN